MQLRSLHLDSGRTWRGGQRQVLLLAKSLRDSGDEPLVVAPVHAPLVERAHEAGLATAAASMRNDWDIASSKRIRSLVRTWNPHFVHAHDARSHAIALMALAGSKTPLIVTRRVTFRPKSIKLKYGPRVNQFIAISEAVKKAMIEAGIARNRIEVVHSGIPMPVVTEPRNWRTELGWNDEATIVGIVGAMTAEKGIEQIYRIAESLSPAAAQRTKFVFLGGARVGFEDIAGIQAYHAGFVTGIYDAMAGLDMLWHPSLEEGLGTSLLDALALGLPPIAFSVGVIPEIITHDVHGLLCSPGDIRAFARHHEHLLDPQVRQTFASQGPPRASMFSVENLTLKTLKVYHKVIGK